MTAVALSHDAIGGAQAVSAAFKWPVIGRVTAPFGSKENGVSFKGITIQATEGHLVNAAADGRVSFVDETLVGYGKTVILEHAGGFSTVYARNSKILVTLGQTVRQGDPIAEMGRAASGGFQGLYFEIRKDVQAQDPLNYLPK